MLIDARVQRVPLSDLTTHPENPRRGDVEGIAESISAHGFLGTLIAQAGSGKVLVGNHRLLAARRLGLDQVPCQFVECSDEEARRILLVDNRSSDLATYDNEGLLALLQELSDTDEQLAGTLFTAEDLAALLLEEAGAQPPPEPEPGDEAEEERAAPFVPYGAEEVAAAAYGWWRARGWPDLRVGRHQAMLALNQLRAQPTERLLLSSTAMLVADSYHPHRWEALGGYRMQSPREAFGDDDFLRGLLRWMVEMRMGMTDRSVLHAIGLHGFRAQEAANFRPGFALAMLRRYAPAEAVVLDTSAGFGGRLLGFLASDCQRYIGIDPAEQTHAGNQRLAEELAIPGKEVQLLRLPAEDVAPEPLAGTCDIALTSPPFFDLEHYNEEGTQAAARYPEAEAWRKGFLRPMLELQFAALRGGCLSIVNIAEIPTHDRKSTVPLPDWCVEEAQACGFDLEGVERYPYADRPGTLSQAKGGPVLLLRRP